MATPGDNRTGPPTGHGQESRTSVPARPRRSGGFTLMELLVVISLMVILAGLLFPVMASLRERARQTLCLSNLHQIATAHLLYLQDWDERFPDWILERPPRPQPYGPWSYWPEMLAPYLRTPAIYHDPSFAWEEDGPASGLKLADYALLTWGPAGYTTEEYPYYRWAGSSLTLPEVLRPAETISLTDGWTTTEATYGFYTVRHGEGLNASFLDGHVRWLPREEWRRTDHDGYGFYWYHYATVDH